MTACIFLLGRQLGGTQAECCIKENRVVAKTACAASRGENLPMPDALAGQRFIVAPCDEAGCAIKGGASISNAVEFRQQLVDIVVVTGMLASVAR